ncbi:MAG: hypothetical protein HGGPFJEG_03077 [Ignavibacteria bacterium]|nr:hypothetical protein [Ignavibacteria bacterium]
MKPSIDPETVSGRITYLMKVNGEIKAYKLCKETNVPEGTFSRSIKTADTWKISHLKKIADYFKVSLDYLISGNTNNINEKLQIENRALKDEVRMLKDKVATYEAIASKLNKVNPRSSEVKK